MRISFQRLIRVAAVLVWAVATVGCHSSKPPAEIRNVLLITIDSLRADHVGCYGYPQPTTPTLDAFAHANVQFRNAYASSPWTLPSHASIFTGLYADTHGVGMVSRALTANSLLLGNVLKNHGYRTGAVVCAPLLSRTYGFQYGFEDYDTDLVAPTFKQARQVKVGPDVTERGLQWMEQNRRKPFFLFLHYWDVHYDYNPPPEYVRMFDPDYQGEIDGLGIHNRKDIVSGMDPRDLRHLVALYDGEIRYTDDAIGKLFAGLSELGLEQNTLVIVTSDHGEEFLDHGGIAHTRTCYEELIRVPLLIRVPWLPAGPRVVDGLTSLVDLFPTVLDLLGIKHKKLPLQGISLADAIRDGQTLPDREIFAETKRGQLEPTDREFRWAAVLAPDRWKLHRLGNGKNDLKRLVFDLRADPGETANRETDDPDRTRKLDLDLVRQQVVDRQIRGKVNADGKVDVDPELSKTLKGLGYIQ
ncbi:MAG: sulfatase [Myxococcales bacterium]|nr:sulfatase [Myxococcales bacterium]